MAKKSGDFKDLSGETLGQAGGLSDKDLEALMARFEPGRKDPGAALAPGARVEGTVVDLREGDVLVELDGKTLGIVQDAEFGEDLPAIGERIQAQFERFDKAKDLAILSVGGVRRDLVWEDLRRGAIVEGTVTATNKGGLTLEVKGIRAFLPVSQIERGRVEDLTPYVGRKLVCEVTAVDRATRNVVLSRRLILDREAEAEKVNALARLSEGEVLKGTVVRLTDFGAFINLGGMDGLLPANKIQAHLRARTLEAPLQEGQQVMVQVVRIDREQNRISLDLKQLAQDTWKRAVEGYQVGDEVTGWVSKRGATELVVSIDEGVTGVVPEAHLALVDPEVRSGTILKAAITAIDLDKQQILLRPLPAAPRKK